MTYVGATPTTGDFKKLDSITTSSATTFNLRQGGVAVYPQSANHCIVSLNGVIQSPVDAFTIVNDTIVFASSLASSDVINFILILGNVNDIGTPSDDSVSTAKIQNLAVSQAKIANDAINADKIADDAISEEHLDPTIITGLTEKTSPADADKLILADSAASNALKYVQKSNLASAAGLVHIKTLTTTNSDISFVHGSSDVTLGDGTYDVYLLTVTGASMQTDDDNLRLSFSIDAGSNYNRTATSAYLQSEEDASSSSTSSVGGQKADGAVTIIGGQSNVAAEGYSGHFWLYNFGENSSESKMVTYSLCGHSHHNYRLNVHGSIFIETTSNIDALRFNCNSGNIGQGHFRLYGISNG